MVVSARRANRRGVPWRPALSVLATAAATVTLAPAPAPAAAEPARQVIAGVVPGWATQAARRAPVEATARLDTRVYLAGRDSAGLAAYARAVSDPHSPSYRKYLSPATYRARFGASPAQVDAVTGWLRSAGLDVRSATPDVVEAGGTAAAAERAFGASLSRYAVGSKLYQAPDGPVSAPAQVGSQVVAVTGLTELPAVPLAPPQPDPGAIVVSPSPCSTYWGQSPATGLPPVNGRTGAWEPCGYTPAQLRTAYGVDASGLSGKGSTVAIVGAYDAPTASADADRFARDYGLPTFTAGQYSEVTPAAYAHTTDGECGPLSQWAAQQAEDIEGLHTMAPGARIRYVASASCDDTDFLAALRRIVDGHLADLVEGTWYWPFDSSVWSLPTADIAAFEHIFVQGAVEGIGFYFPTGDCGDLDPANPNLVCVPGTGSTRKQVQYPASDPWVTAVGGTSIAVGANGKALFQTGEGTTLGHELDDGSGWVSPSVYQVMAGGGGVSNVFGQPFYQAGVVPRRLAAPAAGRPMRVIPDVAMDADYFTPGRFGMSFDLGGGQQAYVDTVASGTGYAESLFVGFQALAQQAQHGIPLGFANPGLYLRARALDDVVDRPFGPADPPMMVVHNTDEDRNAAATLGNNTTLSATAGYDDSTGLGSPGPSYLRSFH